MINHASDKTFEYQAPWNIVQLHAVHHYSVKEHLHHAYVQMISTYNMETLFETASLHAAVKHASYKKENNM